MDPATDPRRLRRWPRHDGRRPDVELPGVRVERLHAVPRRHEPERQGLAVSVARPDVDVPERGRGVQRLRLEPARDRGVRQHEGHPPVPRRHRRLPVGRVDEQRQPRQDRAHDRRLLSLVREGVHGRRHGTGQVDRYRHRVQLLLLEGAALRGREPRVQGVPALPYRVRPLRRVVARGRRRADPEEAVRRLHRAQDEQDLRQAGAEQVAHDPVRGGRHRSCRSGSMARSR